MKAVTCNRRLDKVATCRSCLPIHRLRRESRERHQLQQGDPSVWKLVEKKLFLHEVVLPPLFIGANLWRNSCNFGSSCAICRWILVSWSLEVVACFLRRKEAVFFLWSQSLRARSVFASVVSDFWTSKDAVDSTFASEDGSGPTKYKPGYKPYKSGYNSSYCTHL